MFRVSKTQLAKTEKCAEGGYHYTLGKYLFYYVVVVACVFYFHCFRVCESVVFRSWVVVSITLSTIVFNRAIVVCLFAVKR